jgi:electron transfer flavoprotein beta subunit
MKAKRKPLDTFGLDDLGIERENDIEIGHHAPPPERSRGIMVEDAQQLVTELKNRGLV